MKNFIIAFLLSFGTYFVAGQVISSGDSLFKKKNQSFSSEADTISLKLSSQKDSIQQKLSIERLRLTKKIDSLKLISNPTAIKKYQDKLDSLEQFPQQQYNQLIARQNRLREKMLVSTSKAKDSVKVVTQGAQKKLDGINEVTTKVGIGKIGPQANTNLPTGMPAMPLTGNLNLNTNLSSTPVIGSGATISKPALSNPLSQLPKEMNAVSDNVNKIKSVTTEVKQVSTQAKQYSEQAKSINKDSVLNSKQLGKGIENQAGNVAGLQSLEGNKAAMEAEMKRQQALVEQYKKEMAAKEDIELKVKELVNPDQMKNLESKAAEKVKDLTKYKRRYAEVQDIRNLPKHRDNPMKNLSWRNRFVPGFTFQTFSYQKTWLELSPQVYYKVNGHLSMGVGWLYRFSMDLGNVRFDDFGNLTGGKIFAHYGSYKGFFLRSEISCVSWKPWTQVADKSNQQDLWTSAVGLGKAFSFTNLLKGNMQALYHYTWKSPDPYPSAFEIRFGFDFSLVKNKEKSVWKTKLKEQESKSKDNKDQTEVGSN